MQSKETRLAVCQPGLFYVMQLFANDHFLDEGLTIDFKSVEINSRRDLLASLCILSVPIRFVSPASQQLTLQRLASSSIPNTALQNRHSYLLRKQIVDPQTNAVLTSRIGASRRIANEEADSSVLGYRVWIILFQRHPGA